MNPLLIFKLLRDMNALIEAANRLAGPEKRWTLAITNRSFIASCIALVAALLIAFGVALPVPVDVAADTVYAIITAVALAWAAIERLMGKTAAVWSVSQAEKALDEADALSKALRQAGAR